MYKVSCFSLSAVLLAAATVSAQIPHAPQLLSPADSTRVTGVSPTLIWYEVSGAHTYGIEVSVDRLFSSTVVSDSILTDSLLTVGPRVSGLTYYWRVNAANPGQTSLWSEVWQFTVSPYTRVLRSAPAPQSINARKSAVYDLLGRVKAGSDGHALHHSLTNGCYIRESGGRIKKTAVVR